MATMGGFGTGYPNVFRCTHCKVMFRSRMRHRRAEGDGTNVVRTGRTKPLLSSQKGRCHSRALLHRVEYQCLDCGHIGWTRNADIEGKPVKLDAQAKKTENT